MSVVQRFTAWLVAMDFWCCSLAGLGLMLRLMPPQQLMLLWLLLTGFTGALRFGLRDVLLSLRSTQHKQMVRVAIAAAPAKLVPSCLTALRLAGNHRIVTFLDDNPAYWGRSINGVAIQPPQKLIEMVTPLIRCCWRFLPFPQ